MAIEIYAYTPAAPDAMFPSIELDLKLVVVAPLELREKVEIWCSAKNKEAVEAGYRRRYKFQVTAAEIWS